MTEFVFPSGRIRTDPAANRAWYDAHGQAAGGCDCAYCRNFLAALETLSPIVPAFLDALGVDLRKPDEAAENCREADGSHWYSAWYHISGTLLEDGAETPLAEDCIQSFQSICCLKMEEFPSPHFQLNLELRLPWVLDEPDPQALTSISSLQENQNYE